MIPTPSSATFRETLTRVTANASSSAVISRPDTPALLDVDFVAAPFPGPLPSAWLTGRDLDLLEPLRFLGTGGLPSLPPLPKTAANRRDLAEALAVANRGYGGPGADRLAARLADPAVRVVVSGQQPGLLGGPLFTLAKMVAVSRWAAALEEAGEPAGAGLLGAAGGLGEAGEPAVAVFWVATEDHDWTEVSSTTVLAADGPRSFELGPDTEPLVPVGMRTFGPAVEEVLRGIAEAVPGERYADWLRALAQWYRPDARFGEAFCRLATHMLGDRCPLLLDAMLPALKSAERPWLRRLVERRDRLEEEQARRDAAVAAKGYPLQVHPQRGASLLFLF